VIRLAIALGALVDLALVRLLPEDGAFVFPRLAAATIVLLLPGGLIADALGRRSASATLIWSLTALAGALAITFIVGGSIELTLLLLAATAFAALAAALHLRPPRPPRIPGSLAVGALGTLYGLALWHVVGHVGGDGFFHLARVRKLLELDSLSLENVGEFADGGLHPGYAFPLWHGFLACVARLAGVDSELVVLHQSSVLVPLAFLVVFEAGATLFRSSWLGSAVLAANVALVSFAAGHGGSFVPLALPATASRQLLVPAVLTLVFAHLWAPSRATLAGIAAGGLVLTLVHPTYSLFLAVPIAGFAVARILLDRTDARRLAEALAALLIPTGAVLLSLLPIVRSTASHTPGDEEVARGLAQYEGQIEVLLDGSYRVAPELLSRSGAVAVAALVLLPLAGAAGRRRWAGFALGGTLSVLVLMLLPPLFERFSDLVSLSQSRRAAGFVPFAFVLAGGALVLARLLGPLLLPLALGAGVVLQLLYPGDFTLKLTEDGGPGGVAWWALGAGFAALAAAVALGLRGHGSSLSERRAALAAIATWLFVLPVAAHAWNTWSPRDDRLATPLTPGLVEALREHVEPGDVVFADLETSYRVGAFVPVYVAANPPAHVADTDDNRPYERRADVLRFFRTGDVAIPARYGADWVVVDRERFDVRPDLPVVARDERFTLYRLPQAEG
jgi:hypothetical protein